MGFNSAFKGLKIGRLIFCPKTQIVSEFPFFTTILYSSLYVTHQHVNIYILLTAMFYMDKMFICTAQLVNKKSCKQLKAGMDVQKYKRFFGRY
jgi:hypothetical protein